MPRDHRLVSGASPAASAPRPSIRSACSGPTWPRPARSASLICAARRRDGRRPRSPAAAGRWRSASCSACCSRCSGRGRLYLARRAARPRERRARRERPAARRERPRGAGAGAADRRGAARSARLGAPALFAIAASAVGVVDLLLARASWPSDALGLTPVVFLAAGVFFVLTMLTYVEGNSLHPERRRRLDASRATRSTSSWSFVAGWAIILDYLIVMAIGTFVDLALPRRVLGRGRRRAGSRSLIAAAVIGWVALVERPRHPAASAARRCCGWGCVNLGAVRS